jgi:hypothetical protein
MLVESPSAAVRAASLEGGRELPDAGDAAAGDGASVRADPTSRGAASIQTSLPPESASAASLTAAFSPFRGVCKLPERGLVGGRVE